jgi:hypothetical protein
MTTQTEKTNDKPRKVKTSREITSQGLIKRTKYKREDLLKLHFEQATRDRGFIALSQLKDFYHQRRSVIDLICELYNVPRVVLSKGSDPLISLIAFDHVISHSPELFDCTAEDSLRSQQQHQREQAEEVFRQSVKDEMEQRLQKL